MLPDFMEYRTNDMENMSNLFGDITNNSQKLDRKNSLAYVVPKKPVSAWAVTIKGVEKQPPPTKTKISRKGVPEGKTLSRKKQLEALRASAKYRLSAKDQHYLDIINFERMSDPGNRLDPYLSKHEKIYYWDIYTHRYQRKDKDRIARRPPKDLFSRKTDIYTTDPKTPSRKKKLQDFRKKHKVKKTKQKIQPEIDPITPPKGFDVHITGWDRKIDKAFTGKHPDPPPEDTPLRWVSNFIRMNYTGVIPKQFLGSGVHPHIKYFSSRAELKLAAQALFKDPQNKAFANSLFRGMQVYLPSLTKDSLGVNVGSFLLSSLKGKTWLDLPKNHEGKRFLDTNSMPKSIKNVDKATQRSYERILKNNAHNPDAMKQMLAIYDSVHREQIMEVLRYEEVPESSPTLARNILGHVTLYDDPSFDHEGGKYARVVSFASGIVRKQLADTAPKTLPKSVLRTKASVDTAPKTLPLSARRTQASVDTAPKVLKV